MTVNVQASTAQIAIDDTGVFPEAATLAGPNRAMVIFNLRNNFNSAAPHASRDAFKFSGQVNLSLGGSDYASAGLNFGWIQFMKSVEWQLIYAGGDDSDGQINVNPLPRIGTAFYIDRIPGAGDRFAPFVQNPAVAQFDGSSTVKTSFGDHPMSSAPDKLKNERTGMINYLFSFVDIRKIVTIFAVRNNLGHVTPLAHVNTDLIYSGTFKWRRKIPIPRSNLSSFRPGRVVKGAPADREIARLMANPQLGRLPAYNSASMTALANADLTPLPHYGAQIPPLFFFDGPGSIDVF